MVELTFQEKSKDILKFHMGRLLVNQPCTVLFLFPLYVARSNRKVISKRQIRRDRKKSITMVSL